MALMLRRIILSVSAFLLAAPLLHGQATPTAYKVGDIQVGAGYVRSNPDYSPSNFNGFGLYGDIDLFRHFGAEVEFHRVAASNAGITISEKTYEFGARYRYPIRRFSPYAKILGGLGSFSFPPSLTQNGTYGMYAGGGGVDVEITRKINVRGDYEYQRWGGFPPRGLQPSVAMVGVAYRFR